MGVKRSSGMPGMATRSCPSRNPLEPMGDMVSNVSMTRIVSLFSSEANAGVSQPPHGFTRSWLS